MTALLAWLYLLVSVFGAALVYNVYRPVFTPGRAATLSFFLGWLTGELALHTAGGWMAVSAVLLALGAGDHVVGQLAFVITVGSAVLLVAWYSRASQVEHQMAGALVAGLGPGYRGRVRPEIALEITKGADWRRIALPFRMRHPDVERLRDIPFRRVRGLNLHLDVYRHRSRPSGCPVLLEVHGGGWVIGSKNEQGIPMMLRMAAQGWVCVSVDYRLSPHATFPEHVIDVKKAIQWIHEEGPEYGADPAFVVITGQSAGGHLASLAALTPNRRDLQPGFEGVDTTLRGCVSFYGVYDFLDRYGYWQHGELQTLLDQRVLKASKEEDPELYELASPMSQIHPEAPPFLILHGDCDSLAPVAEARRFAEDLRAVSKAPVVYAELPGAQHAFEIFHSLRAEHVLTGVEWFLALLYSEFLSGRETSVR